MNFVIYICMTIGCFFALAGTVGMLRMPDAFCRMHSSTNISTLGTLGAVAACSIYSFSQNNIGAGIKIIVIGILIILTNPVGVHALCRAAYRTGVRPEKKMGCDDYGRDKIDEQ